MFFSRPPLCREVKGAKREAPRPESASILHAATVRMAFACLQGVGIALTGSAFCPHGERKTVAVRNAHELGALAALGLPNQAPPFWAGTNVPSAKHSFRSNPPASRKCSASLSVMVSITPARTQFWKRRCTVWYAPYRGGKSCHGAPVRKTHSAPLKVLRRSLHGRPRPSARTVSSGKMLSTICHCSSVNASLHIVL